MHQRWILIAVLTAAFLSGDTLADNLWDRRDPSMGHIYRDFKARNVGDVITILIEETTGSDSQEKREMDKKTKGTAGATGSGSTSALGQALRSFGYDITNTTNSQRTFDGKSNTLIDRKFNDRMSVMVVAVLPDGSLVIEGFRQRMITREMRTLRVFGIVRPVDIGPFNTVQSQYIGNLRIFYEGRGPDSTYTNQGWGGRLFNKVWPY